MTVTPIADRAQAAPDGARTNRREEIAPLTSPVLSTMPGVIHGITRRVPGLGIADGNVGYSAPRDTADVWRMRLVWLGSVGLDPETIVVAHQVHGASVASVSASDAGRGALPASKSIGQADALVTNEVGVVLMTLHADCMAILLCDPVRRVVATIHAGWRGTVAGVTAESVRTMMARFGSIPNDVRAYLGPAIGPCCYEVATDVIEEWRAARIDHADAAIRSSIVRSDRWMFDLETANRLQLGTVGVPAANIEASRICTRCQGDGWFSHRGQGPHTGRYGSFIALTESVHGVT